MDVRNHHHWPRARGNRPDLRRAGILTALAAVLADIGARGITRVFNLGDYVGKGHHGREVIDLCRDRCEVNLLGNCHDFSRSR